MSTPLDPPVFFTDRDLGKRFPELLAAAGLETKRHCDHFSPDCSDEEWLETVGTEGWVAVTHDTRIRYKPNELAAVVKHNVKLLVVIGHAPFPQLAKHFVATAPKILAFVAAHPAPWIAKVIEHRHQTLLKTSTHQAPSRCGSRSSGKRRMRRCLQNAWHHSFTL